MTGSATGWRKPEIIVGREKGSYRRQSGSPFFSKASAKTMSRKSSWVENCGSHRGNGIGNDNTERHRGAVQGCILGRNGYSNAVSPWLLI